MGSSTAGVVLLGFIFPIVFARPTLSSMSRLPVVLAWILTAYAAGRLWTLVLRGRDTPISLTFWLFIYVWLGLGAMANTVSRQFPLFGQTFSDNTQVGALTTIMIGLAGYELGRALARTRTSGAEPVSVLNVPTVRMKRVWVLGVVGTVVTAYYTAKYGVGTRFSSRYTATQALFGGSSLPSFRQPNKASAVLQGAALWIPVFVCSYLFLYDWRVRRARRNPRGLDQPPARRHTVYFGLLSAGVILADNPFSNPRYRFGGITLAFIMAVCPLTTPRRFRLMAAGLILAALFVYPYAAVFRTNKRVLQLAPLNSQFRTSPDFGMFQQELNAQVYVRQQGHTWGRQLEGVIFGWVPRSFWPSKPGSTGALILSQYSTILPTSVSIFGWAFVDGGRIWVFLVLVGYAWGSGKLERAYVRRPRHRVSLAAAGGPLFAAFQVFLIRGDLQPAVGELAPVGLVLMALCAMPARHKLARGRRVATPSPPDSLAPDVAISSVREPEADGATASSDEVSNESDGMIAAKRTKPRMRTIKAWRAAVGNRRGSEDR